MTRVQPDRREAVGKQMQAKYYAGSSIRGIAASERLAYGTVRQLLLDVKTKLRPRGGRRRPKTAD